MSSIFLHLLKPRHLWFLTLRGATPQTKEHNNKHQRTTNIKKASEVVSFSSNFTTLLLIFCISKCHLSHYYALKAMQVCIINGRNLENSHWVSSCEGANLITDNPFLYTTLGCHKLQLITDCHYALFAFVKNCSGLLCTMRWR